MIDNSYAKQLDFNSSLLELTTIFESVASLRISRIKNQVQSSTKYFEQLWQVYVQLRSEESASYRLTNSVKNTDKDLIIIITSPGNFSGDIDQKLINEMLKIFTPDKHDLIVIGHHGAITLAQLGISFKKYYKLPVDDSNINVEPLIEDINKYPKCSVFYQSYQTLMVQTIKSIEISDVVQSMSQETKMSKNIISSKNFIFEPSVADVVDFLHNNIMQIALSQIILESKLAQYASRFTAMSLSKQRVSDQRQELNAKFRRQKRSQSDEKLKAVSSALRMTVGEKS